MENTSKPTAKLGDLFDPYDPEAGTYGEYLKQAEINGQLSSFKEVLEELTTEALFEVFDDYKEQKWVYSSAVRDEMLKRAKGGA